MLILVIGMLLIVSGVYFISFPELVDALRKNDHGQWLDLGSPPRHAFSKTLGVYLWVLQHGYQQSISNEVIQLGEQALQKAKIAKYCLTSGVLLVVIGFFYTTLFSNLLP